MNQLKEIDRKLAGVLLEAVERREFRVTCKEVAERLSPGRIAQGDGVSILVRQAELRRFYSNSQNSKFL